MIKKQTQLQQKKISKKISKKKSRKISKQISKKKNINNKTDKYYLKYLFENYKKIKFDASQQTELIQKIIELPNNIYSDYKTNLLVINFVYNVKNNTMKFEMINVNDIPNDSRKDVIKTFLTMFCKWFVNNARELKNNIKTCILIYVSDRIIWNIKDVDKQIPICVYAQPDNLNYILIPDNTFHINSEETRYDKFGLDWEEQKQLFTTIIKRPHTILTKPTLTKPTLTNPTLIKQNKIFFKGADTTNYNHNLRFYIKKRLITENDIEFKDAMIYEWLKPNNYESVQTFTKYKFLLNLPGRYPWSTRLKYLYLSRGFIINVRVKTLGDGNEDFYKSFIDYIVPDILCINIDMIYYYDKTYLKNNKTTAEDNKTIEYNEKNKIEIKQVYDQIKAIFHKYKNKNPYTDKNVNKAYNLINNFKKEDMFIYYYNIIMMNHKIGLKPFTQIKDEFINLFK